MLVPGIVHMFVQTGLPFNCQTEGLTLFHLVSSFRFTHKRVRTHKPAALSTSSTTHSSLDTIYLTLPVLGTVSQSTFPCCPTGDWYIRELKIPDTDPVHGSASITVFRWIHGAKVRVLCLTSGGAV